MCLGARFIVTNTTWTASFDLDNLESQQLRKTNPGVPLDLASYATSTWGEVISSRMCLNPTSTWGKSLQAFCSMRQLLGEMHNRAILVLSWESAARSCWSSAGLLLISWWCWCPGLVVVSWWSPGGLLAVWWRSLGVSISLRSLGGFRCGWSCDDLLVFSGCLGGLVGGLLASLPGGLSVAPCISHKANHPRWVMTVFLVVWKNSCDLCFPHHGEPTTGLSRLPAPKAVNDGTSIAADLARLVRVCVSKMASFWSFAAWGSPVLRST